MQGQCNTKECVEDAQMQRFASMVAEAVHTHSNLRVTVGSASLKWSTPLPGGGQACYWNDAALRAAHPSRLGVLDFYNVHYYDWMYDPSWGYDMCREPASHWKLDKPTVIAELPATSSHYTAAQMLNCSRAHGYAGDLFWAVNDPAFPLAPALRALAAFAAAHPAQTSFDALVAWLGQLPAPSVSVPLAQVEAGEAARGAQQLLTAERPAAAAAAPRADEGTAGVLSAAQTDGLAPGLGPSRKAFSRTSFLASL